MMITYSSIKGRLKNRKTQQWLVAGFITACATAPIFVGQYLLDRSIEQTDTALRLADFWQREAMKWRAVASQSSPNGMCFSGTFKCDSEKCWHVCTGAPAMDVKP